MSIEPKVIADLRSMYRTQDEQFRTLDILEYLDRERTKEDPSKPLNGIRPEFQCHGVFHIPFKTPKWQEWWGEAFYRRDGNDTPRSPVPEVAELQELFAEIKCKHQENHRRWRQQLAEHLLRVEAVYLKPPQLSKEYQIVLGSFRIPFKTIKYELWWNVGTETLYCPFDDDRHMPSYFFSPFETRFVILTNKIHLAIYERRLDEARGMIDELSKMVEEDRLSIANSIASGVLLPAKL